jgi:hypothetical protein
VGASRCGVFEEGLKSSDWSRHVVAYIFDLENRLLQPRGSHATSRTTRLVKLNSNTFNSRGSMDACAYTRCCDWQCSRWPCQVLDPGVYTLETPHGELDI